MARFLSRRRILGILYGADPPYIPYDCQHIRAIRLDTFVHFDFCSALVKSISKLANYCFCLCHWCLVDSILEEGIDLFQDSQDNSNELDVPRGGLLLHAPSKDKVHFPQFVQPLIVSVEDVPPQSLANDAWKQHIIQVQNKESPKNRRRAQRGGVKRKSAPNDEDELVWGLESMLKKQDRKETWPKLQVGEDDACALEYLHLQHNGNVEAAELNLLINLTAGQGKHSFKLDT